MEHRAAPPASVRTELARSGRPLDRHVRSEFEPRFRRDFAAVRVHDDAHAARSAATIGADAYASGSHIVFGPRAWAPHTTGGRKLIAHELAHVAQQPAGAGRAPVLGGRADAEEATADAAAQRVAAGSPAPDLRTASPGVIRRKTGPSTYRDDVNAASVQTTGDTTEGTVHRQEFDSAHKQIHEATAHVRTTFSPKVCEVSVPFDVQYQAVPTAADLSPDTTVAGQAAPTAMPAAKTRPLFDRFLRAVNERLNGWFNVRIADCPHQECADRNIPITVIAREVTAKPQLTVAFVAGGGRSYVSGDGTRLVLIGADAKSDGTIAHEAGHGALGHGDEYLETSLGVRSKDRERSSDMSIMNEHAYRNAVFHERHFAHVREFVSHVVNRGRAQPCEVTLTAVPRTNWDFHTELQLGYANFRGTGGAYGSFGANVGLLTRDSATRFSFGPQATAIAQLSGQFRAAFLLGLRLGVEHRTALPGGGISYGAHVEAGASLSDRGGGWGSYAEGGGRFGYSTATDGVFLSIFTEAAAGTGLNNRDPEVLRYFRLGLGGSLSF